LSELPVSDKFSPSQRSSVSLFGYELIRDDLISDLLGKDEPEILYWAGKKLARKYPLYSIEEMIAFFHEADWGILSIKEEKRKELCLSLTGELVSNRLRKDKNTTFQLEAGFLAQQIEWQKKVVAEAFEHPNKRSNIVQFTIKWDSHDPL
jgi:hypothetical protein